MSTAVIICKIVFEWWLILSICIDHPTAIFSPVLVLGYSSTGPGAESSS